MQKRMREILALVLLAVFAIVGMAAMGWYILVGHNWNVAASNIDDSIGQMNGYRVFVFEGTRLRETAGVAGAASEAMPRASRSEGEPESPSASRAADEALDIEVVASSYREKGAAVFVIDAADLAAYEEPFVVGKGGLRVGLFSVPKPARPAEALVKLKLLRRQKATFMAGITDDAALCEAEVPGVDLLICTDGRHEVADGYRGQAYCVGSPYVGEVQAVIMSPSGVLSSKTISHL